jgi:sulfatase modifying factor 1
MRRALWLCLLLCACDAPPAPSLLRCEEVARELCAGPRQEGLRASARRSPGAKALQLEEARAAAASGTWDFWDGVWLDEGLECAFACPEPPPAPPVCRGDEDCPAGLRCQEGACAYWSRCQDDRGCPEGESCVDGLCLDVCARLLSCEIAPERRLRWCDGDTAWGQIGDAACDPDARQCDLSVAQAAVDCPARGQRCLQDRCAGAAPHPPGGDEDLALIPAGTGSLGDERRQITLTRPFWMQRAEVTQGDWFALMGAWPPDQITCGADCPLTGASWWDALAYANALSAREGLPPCFDLQGCHEAPGSPEFRCEGVQILADNEDPYQCEGYRLPTRAEWEYAARAGAQTDLWSGDLAPGAPTLDPLLSATGWYAGNAQAAHTGCVQSGPSQPCLGAQPVRGRQPNPWGLYDMHGNAAEWTLDGDASDQRSDTDPWSDDLLSLPSLSGGSFLDEAAGARASASRRAPAEGRAPTQGFRLVRAARGACAPCAPGGGCDAPSDCAEPTACERSACSELDLVWIAPSPLGDALWVQRHELTQREAARYRGERAGDARMPEGRLNWFEALALSNLASEAEGLEVCYLRAADRAPYTQEDARAEAPPLWPTGARCLGYRLPTDEEWARAAAPSPLARDLSPQRPGIYLLAWTTYNATAAHPVQQKLPSAHGLYDTLGNLAEWIWSNPSPRTLTAGLRGGSFSNEFNLFEEVSYEKIINKNKNIDSVAAGMRLARTVPAGSGCRESARRRWFGADIEEIGDGPGEAVLARGADGAVSWGATAADVQPAPAGLQRLRQGPDGSLWALIEGSLWHIEGCDAPQPTARLLSEGVRDFSLYDEDLYILTTDGALTLQSPTLQGERAPAPQLLGEELAGFARTGEGLWLLSRGGALTGPSGWGEEGVTQLGTDGEALFWLKEDGCLWRQSGVERRALDAQVRAFARSEGQLYTLHHDGHLWLQSPTAPPSPPPAPLTCLTRALTP